MPASASDNPSRPAAPVRFEAPRVSGEVHPLGAMIGPAAFDIGGRTVEPLAVAPWGDEPEAPTWPGVLRGLRGDWPCVPFGMPETRRDLPADWQAGLGEGPVLDPEPHGYCSNHDWTLTPESASGVLAAIGYPADHPIRWLERTVRGDPAAPAIDFTLTIHARRDVSLPVGLHPTLRLPEDRRGARLRVDGDDVRVWTYPVDAEPGRSRFAPDQRAVSPSTVALAAGGTADLFALDLSGDSEDIVLLTGVAGRVALENLVEGYRVTVEWDAAVLPGCLIWLSNLGRRMPPWNGRFRGIGIEPVSSAFDFGTVYAASAGHPLARSGFKAQVDLKAGRPWTTAYRIACTAL